jgi:diguanylate cyclase (GGDEF)-like protein
VDIRYSDVEGAEQRWFNLVVFPLADRAGAVMTHLDVTAAHQGRQVLELQASEDRLTRLPNRGGALNLLNGMLSSDALEHLSPAVAFLNVDGLSRINDSYGYAAGDELLQAIADRIGAGLRHGDTLARIAGDEFVVIWPAVASQKEVGELAQRLSAMFEAPFALLAGAVTITASVGVARGDIPQAGEELLLEAAAVMREAKQRGPGRTSISTGGRRQCADNRGQIEADLRDGLARGELVLHYQPIIDLQDRAVTGVEALVRWQHPDGLRMPDDFIPMAERSGLIVPLGTWVLDEACRQWAVWAAAGSDLRMAVNLSVRQVADPGLLDVVTRALLRAQMPPERLLLEITESALIDDAELALATLQGLDALGVGIAIDDFGTGYSSLLYVQRYPIHTLKIDRSFVAGIGVNADDDAIVASVVNLAAGVRAMCTAEGVETAVQADALRRLGCRQAQGYLFARPVPADALPDTVASCDNSLRLPVLVRSRGRGAGARAPHAVPPAIAQRMQELHQRGASLHTIAAALNFEESRGPRGVRWTDTTVASVLAANAAQPAGRAAAPAGSR